MIKLITLLVLLNITFGLAQLGPDRDRTADELITSRGFKSEVHTVETSDGYLLTVFRIVNPKLTGKTKGSPVLLMHGLGGNADQWLINSYGSLDANGTYVEKNGITTDCSATNSDKVGNTIGFVLAACGYDVWIGSNRGTKYSTKHIRYDQARDPQYWNFKVDDLSTDDIAFIEYIRDKTKEDNVAYIGHSMGCAQMFQLLASNEKYNKIVKPFIAVAPAVYLAHIAAVAKVAALAEDIPFIEDINAPFLFFPENKVKYVDTLLSNVCSLPVARDICESLMFFAMGFNYNDNDARRIGDELGHFPDDTSFKVIVQMAHRANTNTFAKYDYKLGNLLHYGHLSPPKYDLSKIASENIVLISGPNDLLADQTDIDKMRREMKGKFYEDYVVPDKNFNHLDFMIATNAGKLVTSKILNVLAKFN